jgi:amino acid adenylation domain-containing protein
MTGDHFSFRLSFAQQRLWFLEQLEPGLLAYNLAGAVRLLGPLDVDSLHQALQVVVDRHEALRTTFRKGAEGPEQILAAECAFDLPVVDLSGLSPQEREKEVLHLASIEAAKPFDLVHGPLFRATLYRTGPEQHVLMLSMHHIVTDGWSIGIFFSELGQAYDDLCSGRASSLPELPIQYPDYAEWQRDLLQGETLEGLLKYWRERLRGAPSVLELPTDHPRPSVESHRGAQWRFEIPASTGKALLTLAQGEGATLFMALLAAFNALLFRYTGRTDILVGSPIAGRDRPELEGLIGIFVNTLVLRTDLSGEVSFREAIQRVRESCLGAYEHQEIPFEKLVEELRPERDVSHNPIFQVCFALQNAPFAPLALKNLTVEPLETERHAAQFDLFLQVQETERGLSAQFEYNTDLFEAETIARMAGHFTSLLSSAVADPDRQIARLPMLTEAERRQILVEWNANERDYSAAGITRGIEEQVRRTPQATALVFEDREMSFDELNRRANRLARHLRSLGVGPDTLVAVCVERSIEMVVGLLGVLKAGGAYVPIDPGYPRERQAYMLRDSGAPVLLTQAALAATVANAAAQVVLLDSGWEEIGRNSGEDFENEAGPEHLAYVIYTSGSTGKPKGVLISRRALTNLLWSMREWLQLSERDRLLALATISFDIAGADLWLPLLTGAQMVLGSRETAADGRALCALIEQRDITFLQVTPSTWRLLFEAGWRGKSNLQAVSTGEAMPAEVAARLVPAAGKVWNLYGPTETTIWSTGYEVREAAGTILIGRPVANTQCYILDAQGEPVPAGVTGELYIGGDGLARGYLNQPKLTDEKFVPNPFRGSGERMYRTGDLARYRNNGEIECLGRIDHQVKIRGYRIELGEIEAVLAEHPSVAQAVTIAREDAPGDIRLVAYLTARAQATIDVGELRELLRSRLPEYMVPSAFVVLEAVPLNPSGKVDRKALPAPESARPSQAAAYEPPRTETEARIAAIWKEVLRVDQVGKYDNFFDLGGHSLLLIKVQGALEQEFGRKIAVVELFRCPTIDALARHLTTVEDVSPERDRIQQLADRQKAAINRMRKQADRRDTRP